MVRTTHVLTDMLAITTPLPQGGEIVLRDRDAPALGLRLRASGARSWVVFCRENAREKRRVIGHPPAMKIAQARALADPKSEEAPAPMSVGTFARLYLSHRACEIRTSTFKTYQRLTEKQIIPALGAHAVDALLPADVAAWYEPLKADRPGIARQSLAVLSGMMRHDERLGLREVGTNPCKGLRKGKIGYRTRYLSDEEYARLWRTLDAIEARWPAEVTILRLLIFTGARSSEISGLAWADLDGARLHLATAKSGPRIIWLNRQAHAILDAWRKTQRQNQSNNLSPWVFPNEQGQGPLQPGLARAWSHIRTAAGISDVRIHDLRHSFASVAAAQRVGLRLIGGLLGHESSNSTMGYAHLGDAAVADAAARTSRAIAQTLNPPAPGATRSAEYREAPHG